MSLQFERLGRLGRVTGSGAGAARKTTRSGGVSMCIERLELGRRTPARLPRMGGRTVVVLNRRPARQPA